MSRSPTIRLLPTLLLVALALAPLQARAVAAPPPPAGPGQGPGAPPAPAFFTNPGGPSVPTTPAAPINPCLIGTRTYSAGAYQYWICMPLAGWNGDLVVFAHGYVGPDQPLAVPESQLKVNINGVEVYLTDVLTGIYNIPFSLDYHFAVAVTSYSTNGLAIRPALADLTDMVDFFKAQPGNAHTNHVYLLGVSEGGLITALAAEQPSGVFSGGLAACGPVGDFDLQISHFGDFRVVFDYFFPGLMPGTPVSIPPQFVDQATWNAYYLTTVVPEIQKPTSVISLTQLLKVTHTPPFTFNPPDVATTVGSLLWYSIFATNDAAAKLGGQPYDNHDRVFSGSDSPALDAAINAWVTQSGRRYTASPAALAEIAAHYQTSGLVQIPVVTIHNTGDPVVPYQHESLYRGKVIHNDMLGRLDQYPIDAYGHCAFDATQLQAALATLVARVMQPRPLTPSPHAHLPVVTANWPLSQELLANGGAEEGAAWVFPVTTYPAGYSLLQAYSGKRSLRAGVVTTLDVYSYSDLYQAATAPATPGQARLRFWWYPVSAEGSATALPAMEEEQAFLQQFVDQALPAGALAGDRQYVLLVDQNNQVVSRLLWTRSNAAAWQSVDLAVPAFTPGRQLRLQFGVYNDGNGRSTAMYIDDVSLAWSAP